LKKYIITLDLGTTIIKFGLFNSNLKIVCIHSTKYKLDRDNGFVEFDAEKYWHICRKGIMDLLSKSKINPKEVVSISLCSQAETLVVLDKNNKPLRKAISWLDSRSKKECDILKANFDIDMSYKITGQSDIIATWTITKLLWIKNHEKEIFKKSFKYLLLKDYIIYKFTGKFVSEYTIYNYTYYLDVINKKFWEDILKFVNIDMEKLPLLIEPGKNAGTLTSENLKDFNFSNDIQLNVGSIDQMAGMIGVGNIKEGIISETTGTVMAISSVVNKPLINKYKIPFSYNAVPNTYIISTACESGGISLEWFKNNFYSNNNYSFIDEEIEKLLPGSDGLIFLPYIVGVNSPELNPNAKGVFYGIHISHKKAHFARAVMEGLVYLMKKNLEYLKKINIDSDMIISVGGGSKSRIWNQIKADVLNKEIITMDINEQASLGSAIMAAVEMGFYKSLQNAVDRIVAVKEIYYPDPKLAYRKNYIIFLELYKKLETIFSKNI
jgi:xylulokinase